ncbi:sialidase family protein [Mariniphaga sediminis]|uniref:sialidase family protein n=1 Tax=Mariniphaga sediminis TaxID=1628158 RepID=UPI0035667978
MMLNLLFVFILFQSIGSNVNNPKTIMPDLPKEQKSNKDKVPYQVISKKGITREYQAVPDACRLDNGDILVVFYDGNDHVTYPTPEYPNAGRICLTRSEDEGKTWSNPVVIYDDVNDNRDPHINQMNDGTVVLSFFSLEFEVSEASGSDENTPVYTKEQVAKYGNNPDLLHEQQPENLKKKVRPTGSGKWETKGPYVLKSFDNGKTWENEGKFIATSKPGWNCSAKVKEMPDGTWLLPVYRSEPSISAAWGGVIPSSDRGKTWDAVIPVGKEANLVLAAETDIILLKDKTLYAALRGDRSVVNMHYATSKDFGKTWTPVSDIGFVGHAPSFTRLKSGAILLSYRAFCEENGYYTGLRISRDEAQTWEGPYLADKTPGAYPSTVELKDGTILIIYYEEGAQSSIRALRFKMPQLTHEKEFSEPRPLKTLPLN